MGNEVKKFNLPDSAEMMAETYRLYEEAFTPLTKLAVQNHMMSYTDFENVWLNPWLEKHLGYVDGELAAMSVVTNNLAQWSLISPQYFEAKYPKEYYANQIWYVGFVCVAGKYQNSGMFTEMLKSMITDRQIDLFFMDFCKVNLDKKIIALTTRALQCLDSGVMISQEDVQEFWKVEWC